MKANFLFNPMDKFVPDYNELVKKVEALRTLGQKIVVTIGTWDMFHPGHARYLLKAKEQGDILIVGADSDITVKRYKGPHRPINPQEERVEMLTYLSFVDLVTLIEDVDEKGSWYCGLITMLRPDIFVAVEDSYPEEQRLLIQRYCEELVVLPRQAENVSSTEIIRRAINANPELMKKLHKGD
ncbi:MAG: adenylyltransferase/cytidyltransferase family protein [bacterium]|nr:adenylyltransferase/cytidyltransferase family protein [bacterium]